MTGNYIHITKEELARFDLYQFLLDQNLFDEDRISELIVRKGDHIYEAGESLNKMYHVVSGAVKIGSYGNDGEQITYDVLTAGDFFGNLKYLEEERFYEFSKAIADTKIRTYDLSFFKHLIVHVPNASEWFNYYIVKRWSNTEMKYMKVNWKNVQSKIQFLYNKMNIDLIDSNWKTFNLFGSLTNKDIGDLIGATRQTAATALKKLDLK